MSTTVFTFDTSRPYFEDWAHKTLISTAQGGREARTPKLPAEGLFFSAPATVLLSPARNDVTDFLDFFVARRGTYDTFLFKPRFTLNKTVTDEAIGTGDGAETEFALDSKYIDSSALVVSIDGTPTSAYSLTGNNTAPIVDFNAAPALNEELTATYEFYIPCRFDQDRIPGQLVAIAATDDDMVIRIRTLTWSQDYSGSHLV